MEKLKQIKRIIISIGHGGLKGEKYDSGAVANGITENEQCRKIAGYLTTELTKSGFAVLLLPDWGLQKSINYVNAVGNTYKDWAIELHKDSSENFSKERMSRRCGLYFYPHSAGSAAVAKFVAAGLIEAGAHATTWTRPDTDSPRKRLGFIRNIKMMSHIVELGFIEDINDDNECRWYAMALAKSIGNVLTVSS